MEIDWEKTLCKGRCYSPSASSKCQEIDPVTGKACSLHKDHLKIDYEDHQTRHMYCRNNNDIDNDTDDVKDHGQIVWMFYNKARGIRSIRAL